MNVLCLYNNPCALQLFDWLRTKGHDTVLWTDRLTAEWCKKHHFDLAVSYTYRYILPEEILESLNYNAVNIHNSFLPWNRGADPNIWSILEHTPRGVTLHYISAELDKGDIIAQKFVPLTEGDTFETSYDALDQAAKELFQEAFMYYPYWYEMRKTPLGKGTYHSLKDRSLFSSIIESYDKNVAEVMLSMKETQI